MKVQFDAQFPLALVKLTEMSLLSRFFYKRPPDGLLEFIERVYGSFSSSFV